MFRSTNPYTGQQLESFESLPPEGLEERLELGQYVYRNFWQGMPISERAGFVHKVAAELKENTDTYARLITLEMGKPLDQARGEIKKCAWLCEYFAAHAERLLTSREVDTGVHRSLVTYEPLGAVLGIMPWNFPFWQTFRFAVPALLAGNVALLKPAPNVPQCGLAIERLFEKATGRKGVFQTLFLEVEIIEELLAHPFLAGVAFTGSDRAGSAVAAGAGRHLKKCVLELGGSDAFVVLQDADLERAAAAAVKSRMNNNGQTCIAAKRFIVEEAIAEPFREAVLQEIKALRQGDPLEENLDLSCLARPDLAQNLQQQVEETIRQGASILLEGGLLPGSDTRYQPWLLTDIPNGSPARMEELFGPVACLFPVPDADTAIRLANETSYGLGAALWSADLEKAQDWARQLQAGAIAINGMVASDPRLPFGGIKRSGFGRELGEEGIHEFVNIKSLVVEK